MFTPRSTYLPLGLHVCRAQHRVRSECSCCQVSPGAILRLKKMQTRSGSEPPWGSSDAPISTLQSRRPPSEISPPHTTACFCFPACAPPGFYPSRQRGSLKSFFHAQNKKIEPARMSILKRTHLHIEILRPLWSHSRLRAVDGLQAAGRFKIRRTPLVWSLRPYAHSALSLLSKL